MAMQPGSSTHARPNTLHDETRPNVLRGESPPNTLSAMTAAAERAARRPSPSILAAQSQTPASARRHIPGWLVLLVFVLAVIFVVLILTPG